MLDPSTLVSVIISNFNYARFVGVAIESALALDWPNVEVIVVDDGSTDDSTLVIERYAKRVTVMHQQNTGNAGAYQAGFQRSRGAVVIFLDADDCLEPGLIRAIAPVWNDEVSKVQVQMRTMDNDGNDLGSVLPQYVRVPTPQDIRTWVVAGGGYPTPPGSGNVYSRSFVSKLIPFDLSMDRAADSFLLAAAPYLGDVVTVAEPLVRYRIHGQNIGVMLHLDGGRMAKEYRRGQRRYQYAQSMARRAGLDLPVEGFRQNLQLLTYRAASRRLAPQEHPVPHDSVGAILFDAVRAWRIPQGYSGAGRAALALWILLVCIMPRAAAAQLINWRFVPSSRPAIIKRVMQALGITRMLKAKLADSQ